MYSIIYDKITLVTRSRNTRSTYNKQNTYRKKHLDGPNEEIQGLGWAFFAHLPKSVVKKP